ncbi:MAG: hypothetical protein H7A51_09750 [Akkermansiaceae bacterium]|nr:hypothetical protein [Akkermansiaceae bacterium]
MSSGGLMAALMGVCLSVSFSSLSSLSAQDARLEPSSEPARREPTLPALPDPPTPPKPPGAPANPPAQPVLPAGMVNKPGVTHFGKISVVGSEQNVRGSIASMAEGLRVELNKVCSDEQRAMKLPIIIRLMNRKEDREGALSVASGIKQVQGQYQLMIYVNLGKGVDYQRLRYHLMEMLLFERGLGDGQEVAEGERLIVKPWLIVGMLESLDIKAGRADKRIYLADVSYMEILPLQKVFDATEKEWREMIGRNPIAFRAISGAMVNSLLRQPGGRPAMSAYLADVATFKGENENLLRKHFPGMNQSRNSLQKWVNLELLELGTARQTDVHSILETDKRLDSILKLRYRDKEGAATTVEIDDYAEVLKLKPAERFEAVASARAELERLSYRCFPTYRPLLSEYEMILRDVILGKDKDIEQRLAKLMDIRLKLQESGKRVRDYLDWYYITQSNEVSGDFEKYIQLKQGLEKEQLRPPADDSTQKYLDQVQKIFGGDISGQGHR